MAYASTYTVAQLAHILGVCRQTIRRKIDSGQLAATLDMGAYRITQEAVRDYLAAKGHSAESIDRILLQADEACVKEVHPGMAEFAYMTGMNFRTLVHAGLTLIRQDPAAAEYTRHLFALVTRLSPRIWPADMQARFWEGYDKLQPEDKPRHRSNAIAYQDAKADIDKFFIGCRENAELVHELTKMETATATPNTEESNNAQ